MQKNKKKERKRWSVDRAKTKNENEVGKIKAHEAQPLNKSNMNPKTIVVRIVKKSCNQAHRWNLGSDGCKPAKCSSGAF